MPPTPSTCDTCGYVGGALAPRPAAPLVVERLALGTLVPVLWECSGGLAAVDGPPACRSRATCSALLR